MTRVHSVCTLAATHMHASSLNTCTRTNDDKNSTQTHVHQHAHTHACRHQRSRRGPLRPGDRLPHASQLMLVDTSGAPVALLPSAAVGPGPSGSRMGTAADGGPRLAVVFAGSYS
jgi:hypothetical protein